MSTHGHAEEPHRVVGAAGAGSARTVALADLLGRVAPGVVVLTTTEEPNPADGARSSDKAGSAAIWPATLITASGLALTSRRAVAATIEGRATLAMVLGTHGKLAARNLAAAMPVRVVAICDALDLALVEARPPAALFLPHMPIARGPAPPSAPGGAARADGSVAGLLAVTHDERAGLWAGRALPEPADEVAGVAGVAGVPPFPATTSAAAAVGPGRLVALAAEARGLASGTPLFDGLGRLAGMVVAPPGGAAASDDPGPSDGADGGPTSVRAGDLPPSMVRADTLLRFVLAARAPELRFAGVPPFRRPVLGVDLPLERVKRDVVVLASATPGAATSGPGRGDVPLDLPRMTAKGSLDRFHPGPPRGSAATGRGSAPSAIGEPGSERPRARATAVESAFPQIGLALLKSMAAPISLAKAEAKGDWEPRGRSDAPIGIAELGDYHSPGTREADAFLRSLARPDVRIWWKDADRGFGDDYLLAARAARAAGEQGAFWPMHDLLIDEPRTIDRARVRQLVERLDLDDALFEAALTSDGLAAAVETENAEGAAIAVLATPSFIVNGRIVEGGSVAVAVLAAAVEEAAGGAPSAAGRVPPSGTVAGSAYSDARGIARAAARTVARTLERASRGEGPGPAP
jgi:hypothetical protein